MKTYSFSDVLTAAAMTGAICLLIGIGLGMALGWHSSSSPIGMPAHNAVPKRTTDMEVIKRTTDMEVEKRTAGESR